MQKLVTSSLCAVAMIAMALSGSALAANKTKKLKANSVQFTNLKKPILVTVKNPVITITVPANPTTGYSWFLKKYDRDLLIPKGATYNAPKKAMPGAPGYTVWRFFVKRTAFSVPRITSIKLIYARPWKLTGAKKVTAKVVIGK